MRKFGLVAVGFLLGVIVMLPFVPGISTVRETPHAPSRGPAARTLQAPTDVEGDRAIPMYAVTHVVDGDTIDVKGPSGAVERVRIVGIDTPETVNPDEKVECYGPEASRRLKDLLEGETVAMSSKPDEDKDPYGRLLRYVFVGGDDIGARMIEEGYAVSLCRSFPHPQCDLYEELQKKAMTKRLGRWAACR